MVEQPRSEKALAELKGTLKNSEVHQTVPIDLSDLKTVETVVARMVQQVGDIHFLLLNSGGPKGGPLIEASVLELEVAFRQHVLSSQILLRALVPNMKKNSFGRIVSVLSTSVRMPIVGLGVSNTIRGAMASYMKTLSLELGPFGITANNILPGYTKTQRLELLKQAQAEKTQKSVADIEKAWLETIPLRRFAEPSEVAEAILFLLQSESINGVSLQVDGGRIGAI